MYTTSVVWHHSLPLMNSFNKTEAAVFSCRLCFLRAFPFISLKFLYYEKYLLSPFSVYGVLRVFEIDCPYCEYSFSFLGRYTCVLWGNNSYSPSIDVSTSDPMSCYVVAKRSKWVTFHIFCGSTIYGWGVLTSNSYHSSIPSLRKKTCLWGHL